MLEEIRTITRMTQCVEEDLDDYICMIENGKFIT